MNRVPSLVCLCVCVAVASESPRADEPRAAHERSVDVDIPRLRESSGLGISNRVRNVFWSHNDSGGKPELFAFSEDGRSIGGCRLIGAKALDWEDMACYEHDGVSRIIAADCGDNERRRSAIQLYVFDEPEPSRTTEIENVDTIVVRYPDGAQNCEAVAVDVARNQIILIAKTALPLAGIYTIELPPAHEGTPSEKTRSTRRRDVTAKRIGTLAVPMVSAMDIHSETGDLWVVNYFQAFRFSCDDRTETIAKQLARVPTNVPLPRLKQIEAVAVTDTQEVWVTTEGSPTRLAKVRH